WEAPGIVFGKPLKELEDAAQIKTEVVAQLRRALPADLARALDDENVVCWFLDSDIQFPNGGAVVNLEPLLINTTNSWQERPDTGPFLGNLFLAADYVRTHTDLATMEAANEAGRRATNAILAASRSSADRCAVWPLSEHAIFAPARALDRVAFRMGLP